jgi:hypothetical protein
MAKKTELNLTVVARIKTNQSRVTSSYNYFVMCMLSGYAFLWAAIFQRQSIIRPTMGIIQYQVMITTDAIVMRCPSIIKIIITKHLHNQIMITSPLNQKEELLHSEKISIINSVNNISTDIEKSISDSSNRTAKATANANENASATNNNFLEKFVSSSKKKKKKGRLSAIIANEEASKSPDADAKRLRRDSIAIRSPAGEEKEKSRSKKLRPRKCCQEKWLAIKCEKRKCCHADIAKEEASKSIDEGSTKRLGPASKCPAIADLQRVSVVSRSLIEVTKIFLLLVARIRLSSYHYSRTRRRISRSARFAEENTSTINAAAKK